MPLREFRCPNGHITEGLCNQEVDTIKCECGEQAEKILSVFNYTCGWTYSEKSYEKGQPMELVKNV